MAVEVIEELNKLFNKLSVHPYKKKALFDHIIQFIFTDNQPPVKIHISQGNVRVEEGDVSSQYKDFDDIRKITVIETSTETLMAVLKNELRPIDAWFQNKWYMQGVGATRPIGPWVMSLFRMAQVDDYPVKLWLQ